MRPLVVFLGATLAGAAVACAWALGGASSPAFATLLSYAGWQQTRLAPPPDYQIRLELPQAHRLATADELRPQNSDSSELAETTSEAAVTAPGEHLGPADDAKAPRSGLVALKFDIATFGKLTPAGDGTLRTSKPLSHGGKRVGSVDLALGHGSTVAVDRHALQSLVGVENEKVGAALAGLDGEMVSFDALRDRGVRIRYDALADAVVIDGGI
jgi:hypothetical protein